MSEALGGVLPPDFSPRAWEEWQQTLPIVILLISTEI